MAKSRIPDALSRRDLIEKELAPAQALRLAEAYLEEERMLEALVFLKKADAREQLRKIGEQATLDGDVFLMRQVGAALGGAPERDDWRAVADAARAHGKLRYALDAERQAGQ